MWDMRHLFSFPHPWSRPPLAPSPGPVGDFLSPAASPGSSPGSGDTWELVGSPQSVVHSEIQPGHLLEVGSCPSPFFVVSPHPSPLLLCFLTSAFYIICPFFVSTLPGRLQVSWSSCPPPVPLPWEG